MSLLRTITSGLRTLFRKDEVERELDDEVAQYLELATQAHMRAGLSRADAERAARIDVGGVEATKENVRSGGWEATVETLLRRRPLRGARAALAIRDSPSSSCSRSRSASARTP